MKLEVLDKYSAPVLRISVSLVFLWFGISQLTSPSDWTVFLPSWTSSLLISQNVIIYFNGTFEVILGLALILGIWTRLIALVLSLHLFSITLALGYGPLAVRDFGLALATFSIFLNGADWLCLIRKKKV
jgi:uncharacterized membrane protein YphA (DoxX/SURF4 family)